MLSSDSLTLLKKRIMVDPEKQGTIVHPTTELDKTISTLRPNMVGKSSPALQEVHIFLAPAWTEAKDNLVDEEMVARYNMVVDEFNAVMKTPKVMKNPLLALNFREVGYVYVMQSSLYVLSDNKEEVIKTTHQLADMFTTAGFTVIREKVEASVYGINGIPQTAEEIANYPKTYFEFHIRVQHETETRDLIPLSGKELELLEQLSVEFTDLFGTPVPTSYNKATHPDGGYQRYLNVRFRNCGAPEAIERVNQIRDHINRETSMRVAKIISEYVWYDSNVGLDKGWIDF